MLGFSAGLTLWAFQFGKSIARLDERTQQELQRLRGEAVQLQEAYAKARQISDTAQSLLTTERATQKRLAQQLRQAQADRRTRRTDLGFFERLLPSSGEGLQLRTCRWKWSCRAGCVSRCWRCGTARPWLTALRAATNFC